MNATILFACVLGVFLISFLAMIIVVAADWDYEDDDYGND